MSLFFETGDQAVTFLIYVPLGFVTCLLLSLSGRAGRFRALWDVLSLLACGLGTVALIVLSRGGELRLYQALALLTGAGLYAFGLRRVLRAAARAAKKFSRRKEYEASASKQ